MRKSYSSRAPLVHLFPCFRGREQHVIIETEIETCFPIEIVECVPVKKSSKPKPSLKIPEWTHNYFAEQAKKRLLFYGYKNCFRQNLFPHTCISFDHLNMFFK